MKPFVQKRKKKKFHAMILKETRVWDSVVEVNGLKAELYMTGKE
jgi:hypothetical protein